MRGGSGWQLFLYPCIREQMCAGAAHGKYSACGASGAVLRRGCCILRKLNPKSSGYRQFDGVPRQYVWGVALGLASGKQKYPLTLIAEVFGTAVLGGLCAYPVAILFMGMQAGQIAFYAYVIPFLISTAGGAILSGILLGALRKTGILKTAAVR